MKILLDILLVLTFLALGYIIIDEINSKLWQKVGYFVLAPLLICLCKLCYPNLTGLYLFFTYYMSIVIAFCSILSPQVYLTIYYSIAIVMRDSEKIRIAEEKI